MYEGLAHVITFVTSRYVRLLWPLGGAAVCRGGPRHIVKSRAAGRTTEKEPRAGERRPAGRAAAGEGGRKATAENPRTYHSVFEVRNELEHPPLSSVSPRSSGIFTTPAWDDHSPGP